MDTQTLFPPAPANADNLFELPADSLREELERCGVTFDEAGQPVWYTVPEWFDELDWRLIGHFGEEYSKLADERRALERRGGGNSDNCNRPANVPRKI